MIKNSSRKIYKIYDSKKFIYQNIFMLRVAGQREGSAGTQVRSL